MLQKYYRSKPKAFDSQVLSVYRNKNVFIGELGCDGPSASVQVQYLPDFTTWAYAQQYLVEFIWVGLNYVGSAKAQLIPNGQLTAVGQVFKNIHTKYPPKYTPQFTKDSFLAVVQEPNGHYIENGWRKKEGKVQDMDWVNAD